MDTTKLSTDELRAYWEERAATFMSDNRTEPFTTSFRHPVNIYNLDVCIGYAIRLGEAWSERAAIFIQAGGGAVILIVDNTAKAYEAGAIRDGLYHILWSAPVGKQIITIPMRCDDISDDYALTHGGDDNTRIVQPNT